MKRGEGEAPHRQKNADAGGKGNPYVSAFVKNLTFVDTGEYCTASVVAEATGYHISSSSFPAIFSGSMG